MFLGLSLRSAKSRSISSWRTTQNVKCRGHICLKFFYHHKTFVLSSTEKNFHEPPSLKRTDSIPPYSFDAQFAAREIGAYRYGFNGKELDKPGMGGGQSTYDYGFRIYNPAIAKFLSVDPLTREYPWYTPYQFAGNKPIWAIDLDGLEEFIKTTFFNSAGEIYNVEIQVIKATTDFGMVTGMQSNSQLVHQSYVIYDDAGNYDVYNAGVVEGVWSNAPGVGANDPNGNPVGGSTAFNQQENSLIWYNTPMIDPVQGNGNSIGYPNSETGKLGYSFVPAGGAVIVNDGFSSNPDGIVQYTVPSANGAPNPNTNGAAPTGVHNTEPNSANRVSTNGTFRTWRGAGKDFGNDNYLSHTRNPIFRMVGKILDHTSGEGFNVPSEANKNNSGAATPYTATYH
jgi:RHS repeat-associated protein